MKTRTCLEGPKATFYRLNVEMIDDRYKKYITLMEIMLSKKPYFHSKKVFHCQINDFPAQVIVPNFFELNIFKLIALIFALNLLTYLGIIFQRLNSQFRLRRRVYVYIQCYVMYMRIYAYVLSRTDNHIHINIINRIARIYACINCFSPVSSTLPLP